MRQRILTPAMFQEDALLDLNLAVRWTLAGLKLMADDRGIVEADLDLIRQEVWKGRAEPLAAMLVTLENAGFIRRFKAEFTEAIAILDFIPEQKPRQGRVRIAIPAPLKSDILDFIGWNKVTEEQRKFFVLRGAKGDFSEIGARPSKPHWRADKAKAPKKFVAKHGVPRRPTKTIFDEPEEAPAPVAAVKEVPIADRQLKSIKWELIEQAWNEVCIPMGLERVTKSTTQDRRQIEARMNEAPELRFISGWNYYFLRIAHTQKIMNGEAGIQMRKSGWMPDFRWAVTSGAWLKVREKAFGRPVIPSPKLDEFSCRQLAATESVAV